ncbi:nucleus accumbens-associated protein 2-like isoform X2 [Poeciliopsis prolifica]|uniref:nucleus accumbens-associated protein 2-like isoform X2 n=1 Tax=Poeciliopsis prolifica TaxID=188132 RepID=UPI00241368A0|nr:nucleus accumbens-associated protein 2-like isoform X2 [Poeciliopsis prolifica]
MAEGLLQVEIPDFGSSVLGSLNEQRLMGHYCDVSILVQGQAFKAHRAVLAASSLYFRDLFSSVADPSSSSSSPSSSQAVFELPSSVTPTCFQQILSFCYTGRLSMAASEQLVLMYTAGYLQIQNIVERGMELMMMKATSSSSPLCCDSQTTSADELGGFDAPVAQQQHSAPQLQEVSPDQASLSPEELLLAVSRIKQERSDTPPAEESGGGEEARADVELQSSRSSALCYLSAGGGLVPGLQSYLLAGAGRSSPEGSSVPTDSPPSQPPTEEELEEDYYGNTVHPGLYQHIYGHTGNPYIQEKLELLPLPLVNERRPCVLVGRDNMALPASLISQIGYRCHPSLYAEGDPGEKVELVAGSGVFMTRGQLMNCHLCAGVKHKVLLRRLLATFFDRNTLANSCGTGIRSSTNDPSRKPLDNRVLNTVKQSVSAGSQRSSRSSLMASPPPHHPIPERGREEQQEQQEESGPPAAPSIWTCGSSAPPTSAWRLRPTRSAVRGRRQERRRRRSSSLTCSSPAPEEERGGRRRRRSLWGGRQMGMGGNRLNSPQICPSPCPPLPPLRTLPLSLQSPPPLTGDWLTQI